MMNPEIARMMKAGFFGMGGISASAEKAAHEHCRDLRALLTDNRRPTR
jgi:hypothetical protein